MHSLDAFSHGRLGNEIGVWARRKTFYILALRKLVKKTRQPELRVIPDVPGRTRGQTGRGANPEISAHFFCEEAAPKIAQFRLTHFPTFSTH
jgi:hypothetical protein